MPTEPEGAQRSEDGKWWWDGEQWQPVEGTEEEGTEAEEGETPVATDEHFAQMLEAAEGDTQEV